MSAAGRWIARRMAAGLLVVAAVFALVTLVPLRGYKPSCGDPPRLISVRFHEWTGLCVQNTWKC